MPKNELQVLIEQKVLLTGPVRARTAADAARIRAALRASRTR